MNHREILTMVNTFPIGSIPKNKAEVLSKVAIISFLSRFQDQFSTIENIDERELVVKQLLCEALGVKDVTEIPSLSLAENILNLSAGFVQDFNKTQYIKENNPDFDHTYHWIANNLGLVNDVARKGR